MAVVRHFALIFAQDLFRCKTPESFESQIFSSSANFGGRCACADYEAARARDFSPRRSLQRRSRGGQRNTDRMDDRRQEGPAIALGSPLGERLTGQQPVGLNTAIVKSQMLPTLRWCDNAMTTKRPGSKLAATRQH
jgi:hypothetical protein